MNQVNMTVSFWSMAGAGVDHMDATLPAESLWSWVTRMEQAFSIVVQPLPVVSSPSTHKAPKSQSPKARF